MVEAIKKIDQTKETIIKGLAIIEQKYPQIVEIVTDKIRNAYTPVITSDGGEVREEEGEIEPFRNLFFNPELTPEDRISNLFFLSQIELREGPYRSTKGKFSPIENFFSIKKGQKINEENTKIADAMRVWIHNSNTPLSRSGVFDSDTRSNFSPTKAEFLLLDAIPRYDASGQIRAGQWKEFIAEVAKLVYESLENGMSVEEIIGVLKQKEYLVPFIGSERKLTLEEAIELLEKK